MDLHHIGIACDDIKKKRIALKKTLPVLSWSEIVFDPEQSVELCLVRIQGSPAMELVSGKPVEKFIKAGSALYHLCYEVNDIRRQGQILSTNGAMQISKIKEAALFNCRPVVFFYTEFGIIELLEKEK